MTEYFVYGTNDADSDGDIALCTPYASPESSCDPPPALAWAYPTLYRVTPVEARVEARVEAQIDGVWLVDVSNGSDVTTRAFKTELEALRFAHPLEGFVNVYFRAFDGEPSE